MDDRTSVTRETYDRIASEFADHVWGIHLDAALNRFSALVAPGGLVLDLGCGPGRDTALLRERGYRAVGLDLSMGMLREARGRVGGAFACADMRALPLPAACLDGIWLNAALLHVPREDVPRTLRGIRRALRPGGALFVAVKQGDGAGWTAWQGHARYFTYFAVDELAGLLAGAGFDVTESRIHVDPATGTPWIQTLATATRDVAMV